MQLRPLNLDDELISPADLEVRRDGVSMRAGDEGQDKDQVTAEPLTTSPESAKAPAPSRRRGARTLGLLVLAAAFLSSTTSPDPGVPAASAPERVAAIPATPAAEAIPVTATRAKRQDVAIYRTGLGSVQAFNTVAVTSRVDGQLESITFEEGQEVKAGHVLARIDDRLYQAAVRQKEAQLRAATALVKSSKADLERMATLLQSDVGSRQNYETQLSLVEQNEAQVDAASADLENARLQLDYATIRSPIDGRVGFRQIDVGNMVRSIERSTIATVTQVQPINIVFTLPQEDLLAVGGQLAAGERLSVTALARDGKLDLGEGRLSTIDNQVDANTGTFKLKARFENEQKTLWPGEFVTVRLMVENEPGALVVPAQSVQRSQQGAYVYVVAADETAQMRPVEVGLIQDGLAIIRSGVEEGEQVVVDGQFKLEPGSRVAIAEPAPAATASDAETVLPPG